MKQYICLGFILLSAAPLLAETYSWVDDSGTYNFTEDYSSVPKKYRKKVKWREDVQQDARPQLSPDFVDNTGQTGKTDTKIATVPGGEKELYGGKSRADWRREMDALEAELTGIEQHMEQLRKQIYDPKGVSRAQFELLKKDYDDSRAVYNQKYKNYTDLVDTVRKAGITVNIKK
ncbi:MAG: DUF4124 domain-containing protein [Desulfuromonadaceae bacterium]|nr:DUF4124 domain-containing protein [Desulfuromonadaceae bacterium]